MGKNAIVIGASSGIGKCLAEILSRDGYRLGLTGRRVSLLQEMKDSLPHPVFVQEMDITIPAEAEKQFENLVNRMGNIDLVIVNAGIGQPNPNLDAAIEIQTIDTNVSGFVAMADAAFRHFQKSGKGHLVGISSVAALRGGSEAPAYNASKAFVSSYMEGLRLKALKNRLDITVTDVRPGYVDTQMIKGGNGLFWVSSPEKAAAQIVRAIQAKKRRVYITKRWRLIAWLMRWMPDRLYAWKR